MATRTAPSCRKGWIPIDFEPCSRIAQLRADSWARNQVYREAALAEKRAKRGPPTAHCRDCNNTFDIQEGTELWSRADRAAWYGNAWGIKGQQCPICCVRMQRAIDQRVSGRLTKSNIFAVLSAGGGVTDQNGQIIDYRHPLPELTVRPMEAEEA